MRLVSTLFICSMIVFISCKKEAVQTPLIPGPIVEMEYISLNNLEVKVGIPSVVLDIDKDGAHDLIFGVLRVGDPVYKVDKSQFSVMSSFHTSLPVNVNEQVAVMNKTDIIPIDDFNSNNWYNASGIVLMEKNEFATGAIRWRGNWLNSLNKYMPFQVEKNGQRYNGWLELSHDQLNERLILHRAAISRESGKAILAGY